jgi:large subunit ribosomal protein L22
MENIKEAKVQTRFLRISQRKMLGTCALVRGKEVAAARAILMRTGKKAARLIEKSLTSAVANAQNKNMEAKYLFIKKITADGGPSYKRHIAWSRGTSLPIKKRTTHLTIVLEEKPHEKKAIKPVSNKQLSEGGEKKVAEVAKAEVKKTKPVKKDKAVKGKAKVTVKKATS